MVPKSYELVMESTPVVTSASEDEDKDSDDSSESSKSSRRKKKFKFDFTGKLHKITEERKSKSRESLKDAIDGDAKSSPILVNLSAATLSIVLLMTGYLSSTSLKCPTDREYKFTYVSARTLATPPYGELIR
jgi:hypothetical protein